MFFKQKQFTVVYATEGNELLSRDVYRVPNTGEMVKLECYGDQMHRVLDVMTVEKHDPNKNIYIVTLKRANEL